MYSLEDRQTSIRGRMSGRALSVAVLSCCVWVSSTLQAQPETGGLLSPGDRPPAVGRPVSEAALAGFDRIVGGTGDNLPAGSGTAAQGQAVFQSNCVACHGAEGEGVTANTRLVGGDMQSEGPPLRTVGSYWPRAVTLFDYIRRAMPADRPKSLSDEEVYQVTAYVLFLNDIIDQGHVLDAGTLPAVEMPNADGFRDFSDVR